jgi:hypothetical protein
MMTQNQCLMIPKSSGLTLNRDFNFIFFNVVYTIFRAFSPERLGWPN